MINQKEILSVLLAAITFGYLEAFSLFSWQSWAILSLLGLIIVGVHVFAQKIVAFSYNSNIESTLWKMERYGFEKSRYFDFPIPTGLLVPLAALFISFGYFKILTLMTFEAAPLPHKIKPFSHITETQLGIIALSGSVANMLLALITFLLGFKEFAMFNLYYAFFSLIPFSNLDGMKVLFGSRMLWMFSFFFVLVMIILLELAGFWPTLISAVVIALTILIAYYVSVEAD